MVALSSAASGLWRERSMDRVYSGHNRCPVPDCGIGGDPCLQHYRPDSDHEIGLQLL